MKNKFKPGDKVRMIHPAKVLAETSEYVRLLLPYGIETWNSKRFWRKVRK